MWNIGKVIVVSSDVDDHCSCGDCREEVEVWLACGIDRGPQPLNPEESTVFEYEYDGCTYRTLDKALLHGKDLGCQEESVRVPNGWELAPAYPEVLAKVSLLKLPRTREKIILWSHYPIIFAPVLFSFLGDRWWHPSRGPQPVC